MNGLIAQINILAKKQQNAGLTEDEKKEQDRLRKLYLEGIRGQVKQQLDRVRFEDEES